MPPRLRPSHKPRCEGSAIMTLAQSLRPSPVQGISCSTRCSDNSESPSSWLAAHRCPDGTSASEWTGPPETPRIGTKRLSCRYPTSPLGVEAQIFPLLSWNSPFGGCPFSFPSDVSVPPRLPNREICPFFQRFNALLVPIHMPPSFVARTDQEVVFDKPCLVEIVETAYSRKQSSPSYVATQMLPSRSSRKRVT